MGLRMDKIAAADLDQCKEVWASSGMWARRRAGVEGQSTHRMMLIGGRSVALKLLGWHEGAHRLEGTCESSEAGLL